MNNKYLSNMLIITLFFCSVLDAQCRRGETLRVSNGIETKEVECREATRLIYNEDYWPYSIEDEREDRCPQLASSAQQYYSTNSWELSANAYSELINLRCDEWNSDWVNPNDVYLYWAVALEYLGQYDKAEAALVQGLEELPENIDLIKRLAYAYKKQDKIDEMIIEYERLMDMGVEDTTSLRDLASAYGQQGRTDEQVSVLKKILVFDPNNSAIQSELARAYEESGDDPLEIFKDRYENNTDNVSYATEYADKLIANGDLDEAIDVLKNTLDYNRNNNMIYMKLGKVYGENSNFEDAIDIFEDLFELDRDNYRVAILISENNIQIDDFESAYDWANKALKISKNNAETLSHMGNLYYKAMQLCRTDNFSRSDKIIASLAYNYFLKAEKKGNSKYFKQKNWLEDNDDVLFGYTDWFMLNPEVQATGKVKAAGRCYDWANESLPKQSDW